MGSERGGGSGEQVARRVANGWRLPAWYGLWVGGNLVLGVVFAYPLMIVLLVGLHVRAMLFDRPDSPFSPKEIEGGEASAGIAIGVILLIVTLLVVTTVNWALIRRLRLPTAVAKVCAVVVTVGLLLVPVQLMF